MHNPLIRYRPPRIAMLLLAIAAAVHWLTPIRGFSVFSSVALSIVLAALGFAVMLFAWWQFKEHAVAICPGDTTERLITDGVYRFTRNPMYLGIGLMLTGAATWIGTPPFYAAALCFFVVMDRLFRRYEEEKLAAAFGRTYLDYKTRVRPWI